MEEKRERTGGAGHSRGDTESEEEDCGLAIFEISFLHIYLVSGYLGDANHDYVCIHVDQLSLCHTGSLQSSGLTAQYSPLLDPLPQSLNTSLHHIILRLPERLQLKPTPRGSDPSPMILVAMDIRFEPERNSKTNKCAISLQGTLLNHYVTPSHLNCFTQLGEFLSLKDEPIEGYESPSLITEMHLHLQDLCLEYCPLHLPVKALLGLGSVQLSTSLVAGSPLLVVRLLVDHTHLALSDSTHHSLSVRDDYVCVLDLDWFELTLRLCNTAQFDEESKKLFSQQPEVSLECSSNILQIHTCVDSCMALRDLLVYLASDGDLRPAPDKQTKINSTASPDSVDSTTRNSSSLPPPSSTSEDMDDLLSDAMEDSPLTKTSPPTVPTLTSSVTNRPLLSTSVTSSTNKNKKMHVVEHGERSLDIDFGDSDEEEEGSVQVVEEQGERERCTSSGGVSGGIIADLIDAMEEEEEEEEEEDASLRKMKRRGKEMKKTRVTNDLDDDDGFCLLNAPTSTYVAPGAKPVIKCLLSEDETWKIVDNHFAIPEQHVDQLKRPKHFPEPVIQYTLKELTIVWHLYGGHDFALLSSSSSPSSSPHTLTTSSSGTTSRQNSTISSTEQPPNSATYSSSRSGHIAAQPSLTRGSSSQGYNSRSSSGSVHAGRKGTGKGGRSQSGWSFRGGTGRDHTVHMEVEVDKMRLQYEVFPQDTTEASRFAFLVRDLEIRDRLTQSNINKFLYQYTTETMPRQSNANMVSLKVLSCRPELEANPKEEEVSVRLSILPIRLNIDQDSFYFMFEFFSRISDSSSFYYPPSSSPPISTATTATPTQQPSYSSTHREQVFIHSFVFQPALPIKIDYTTKWRFPTDTMGTLPGILISLYHLDNSELTLKSLNCKTGFLGWDSLLECVAREWTNDIMSRQLPLILKGVGPTHYITQFVHGVVDLVRLPYHQYQEDGRIVWGLQRGASSFSTSTGLAVVELTSRTLETLQSMAQMVYDLVSPVPVEGGHANQFPSLRRAPHQPQDFREGVSNAYDVVASGLTGTAVDLYTMASQEHEERGVTGAVGGILRQIPGTVVKPVILLSEATRHVLGGVKNQFVPDARREAKEKWKTADTMTDH